MNEKTGGGQSYCILDARAVAAGVLDFRAD